MKYLECDTDSRSHVSLRLNVCSCTSIPLYLAVLQSTLKLRDKFPGACDHYSIELLCEVTQTVCSQDRIFNSLSLWLCVNISLLLSYNRSGPFWFL